MKKYLLTVLFLIFTKLSFAESFIEYDPNDAVVANRVITFRASGDQSAYLSDPDDLTSVTGSYIIDADLSSVSGVPQKHWKVDNGSVIEMTTQEKADVEQAIIDAIAAAEAARITAFDDAVAAAQTSGAILTKIDTAIDNVDTIAKWRIYEKKKMRYLLND